MSNGSGVVDAGGREVAGAPAAAVGVSAECGRVFFLAELYSRLCCIDLTRSSSPRSLKQKLNYIQVAACGRDIFTERAEKQRDCARVIFTSQLLKRVG